jgi:hypothetical protein
MSTWSPGFSLQYQAHALMKTQNTLIKSLKPSGECEVAQQHHEGAALLEAR